MYQDWAFFCLMASSPASGQMQELRSVMLPELRQAENKGCDSASWRERRGAGGEANANVHLEMEGRRRRCGVMHYRVSGSHSLRVSDDITAWWREGEREGGEGWWRVEAHLSNKRWRDFYQYSVVWGPVRVSTRHGHRGAPPRRRGCCETEQRDKDEWVRPCPPLPDQPSVSAFALCLVRSFFTAAVFVCRLSLRVATEGPTAEGMWEARVCPGALGECQIRGRRWRKKEPLVSLEQTVADEVSRGRGMLPRGALVQVQGGLNSAQEGH